MSTKMVTPGADDTLMSRRGFLRTGLAGAALLGTASAGIGLTGCSDAPKGSHEVDGKSVQYHFLTEDDRLLLLALAPAILAGALPQGQDQRLESLNQTVAGVDAAIYRFSPSMQSEFRQLFDLLHFSPTRALMAGVWQGWDTVDPERADVFLNRWKSSSIDLFTSAYIGLVKITNVAFYGMPATWSTSHYPGPPAYALTALPQFQKS